MKYIHQINNWTNFTWNEKLVSPLLGLVRYKQSVLNGMMLDLGFNIINDSLIQVLTADAVKSSEIEGKKLNSEQVRSSIAKRLGIETGGLTPADRDVDGIVEIILDATQKFNEPLTKERLFNWHTVLFPTGRNEMGPIIVGNWRNAGMEIVSGPMGKEKVYYEAPNPELLEKEMSMFLEWFNDNDDTTLDGILKSAISHLWFVTIHPFQDGNGRISRTISDMQLSKSDGKYRFFSMSSQIRKERKKYYDVLEKTQKGTLDITEWILWFLNCMIHAISNSEEICSIVLKKAKFWNEHSQIDLNERQRMMINKLFDGFFGNLTSSKWAKITKSSHDTALRDIQYLIDNNILIKSESGGRSTNYILKKTS